MGGSLWDKVVLPLMNGIAIQIVVVALCFLSVRLWICLIDIIKAPADVGEGAHDQPLPDNSGAAAHAHGVPDLEMGNGSGGPPEGGESIADPEMEMGTVNSGVQRAPKALLTRDAATGSLVQNMRPVAEMDVPHSRQHEQEAAEGSAC